LIVGDFTARVGDPSGRSATRPRLTKDEVDRYAEPLLEQFWRIVDPRPRRTPPELRMAGATRGRGRPPTRLDHDGRADARTRRLREAVRGRPADLRDGVPVSLLQGYDSVAVDADVELGGTDQLFNLLVGRELQRDHGQDPQVALTMPLLEGTDGVQKMSQSLGNYIGVDERPEEMFGKLMSIPDPLIPKYELLATDLGPDDHDRVVAGLKDGSIHPNEEKRRMARTVVDLYHPGRRGVGRSRLRPGAQTARAAERGRRGMVPRSSSRYGGRRVGAPRARPPPGDGARRQRSEARRLQAQGGVRADGQPESARRRSRGGRAARSVRGIRLAGR
jgi:tyrosyl-tRNA synthetase